MPSDNPAVHSSASHPNAKLHIALLTLAVCVGTGIFATLVSANSDRLALAAIGFLAWTGICWAVANRLIGTTFRRLSNSVSSSQNELTRLQAEHLTNLEKVVEDVRAAEQTKSAFLANMSHELRTPINGITGMSNLLSETALDSEQSRYVETVSTCAASLLGLVNNILDLTKIEAGKLELDKTEFDFAERIDELCDMRAFQAEEKGLEFFVDISPEIRERVIGDPFRFGQIFSNLINNAIQYTDTGEIEIGATCLSETNSEMELKFFVRDTGVGIAKERHQQLFDAFHQANMLDTRKGGGLGFGLSIAARLIKIQGGKMGFESEEGKGSTFWFTLTMQKADNGDWLLSEAGSALNGQFALIVDSCPRATKQLTGWLKYWNCGYRVAPDIEAATHALKEIETEGAAIDIVVIDHRIPSEDQKLIFSIATNNRIMTRVILTHPMGCHISREEMENIGFDGNVVRPLKPFILLQALLGETGRLDSDRHSSSGDVTLFVNGSQQLTGTKVLLVEDEPTNRAVAKGLLRQLGISPDEAADGVEAVEILKKQRYDLILMDCQMPQMDGYTATGIIRSEKSCALNACTPIIALTANALSHDRAKCLNAGMSDYIAKPIDQKDFEETLIRWQGNEHEDLDTVLNASTQISEVATAREIGPSKGKVLDITELEAMFEGNRDVISEIIAAYRESLFQQLDDLKAAIEASADIEEIRLHSHTIKGGAGNLGANLLRDAAWKVESACIKENLALATNGLALVIEECAKVKTALAELDY